MKYVCCLKHAALVHARTFCKTGISVHFNLMLCFNPIQSVSVHMRWRF